MTTSAVSRVQAARPLLLSIGYGAAAGAIAAVTFALMKLLQHVLWLGGEARWYVFVIVVAGGVLLAWLRANSDDVDLDAQIAEATNPKALRRKKTAFLALSAIIAVGFGGSIGPEAGLLAVVAQLSAIISDRVARSREEAQLIGHAGNAAALAGLYGSPPAGALYSDDALGKPTSDKLAGFAAGISGFLAFLGVVRLVGIESHGLHLPEMASRDLSALAWSVVPATVGALVALGYGYLRDFLVPCLRRLGPAWRQTLLGSVLLAALLAAWPVLRFSGHDELSLVGDWAGQAAWGLLLAVAAAKALATALCLAAGWHGGEFFPLAFVGGALGALCLAFVPGLDAGTAIVAGLTAAATVALGKPVAVMLIVVLMVEHVAPGPVMLAVLIAMVVLRVSGRQPSHH